MYLCLSCLHSQCFIGFVCILSVSLAQGIDIRKGATLFSQSCIGCHDGGGNVIQPVSEHIIPSPL